MKAMEAQPKVKHQPQQQEQPRPRTDRKKFGPGEKGWYCHNCGDNDHSITTCTNPHNSERIRQIVEDKMRRQAEWRKRKEEESKNE